MSEQTTPTDQTPETPPTEDQTPSGAAPQGTQPTDNQQTYEVTVDGETRQVTLDELLKGYNLESAARKRMEEAATLKKSAHEAIAIKEAVGRLVQGDQNALNDIVNYYVPEELREQTLEYLTSGDFDLSGQKGQPNQGAQNVGDSTDEQTKELQKLMEEFRQEKQEREQEKLARLRDEIFTTAEKGVDSDPILGKIDIVDKDALKKRVKNEVQRRVGLGGQDFREAVQEVIQEERSFWDGITKKLNSVNREEYPGIGATSTGGGMPSPKEPPKADVPTTAGDKYLSNFKQRFAYKLANKLKTMGGR